MRRSIRDVAKQCGVSAATVSRVLNDPEGAVLPATREKVLRTVRELGYRPSPRTDRHAGVRQKTVGVLLQDLGEHPLEGNPYIRQVLDGIIVESAMNSANMSLFIQSFWPTSRSNIRLSYDGRCDGVVVIATRDENEGLTALWERGVPIVSVGSAIDTPPVPFVDVDNELIGREAVEHLVSLGHRRIVYFGPARRVFSSRERALGYAQGMAECGLAAERRMYLSLIDVGNAADRVAGHKPMARVASSEGRIVANLTWADEMVEAAFSDPEPPTAVVCWSDHLAMATIEAIRRRGLAVPADVSVTGVDDLIEARTFDPPITTFPQPLYEIGRKAVNLLMAQIARETQPSRAHRFGTSLIVRGSTAAPRPIRAEGAPSRRATALRSASMESAR